MVCNQCGAENQEGVKFCAGCGNLLAAETVAEVAPAAVRPARTPKGKPINGTLKIMVIVFVALTMLFGMCHLFVDYVVSGKGVSIEKAEEGKSIYKSDIYAFKSSLYNEMQEALDEEKEALEDMLEEREEILANFEEEYGVAYDEYLENMEEMGADEESIREVRKEFESTTKIKGGFGWMKAANIFGGIFCILIAAIGVLYLLKNVVPVYDLAFGKLFKGRTALFVMGLAGAVVSLLQLLMASFTKVTRIERFEGELEKTSYKYGAHWTVWAFLIISVLFVVYDMATAKNKKK